MPPQFTFGDIEQICRRLGMNAQKGKVLWRGVNSDGQYRQTTIHSHSDGVPVSSSTARAMAKQLRFTDVEDMYDFLNNKRRR